MVVLFDKFKKYKSTCITFFQAGQILKRIQHVFFDIFVFRYQIKIDKIIGLGRKYLIRFKISIFDMKTKKPFFNCRYFML